MSFLDMFKTKGALAGEVVLSGLPEHWMYSVSVSLFRVASASSPPPFGGDPPVDEYNDTEDVKEAHEFDAKPLLFCIQRPIGFYYLAVGVIAYFKSDGKTFAQVERFFPMTRPCQVLAGTAQPVELAVAWPDIPLNELPSYGTVYPRNSGQRT